MLIMTPVETKAEYPTSISQLTCLNQGVSLLPCEYLFKCLTFAVCPTCIALTNTFFLFQNGSSGSKNTQLQDHMFEISTSSL